MVLSWHWAQYIWPTPLSTDGSLLWKPNRIAEIPNLTRHCVAPLRPKHTWRCASCVKNGTNASIVYCAHLAIFTGVHNVICRKIKVGLIFCVWRSVSGISCIVMCVIYHTKCAHTAQKIRKCWRTPLDVIRPLAKRKQSAPWTAPWPWCDVTLGPDSKI